MKIQGVSDARKISSCFTWGVQDRLVGDESYSNRQAEASTKSEASKNKLERIGGEVWADRSNGRTGPRPPGGIRAELIEVKLAQVAEFTERRDRCQKKAETLIHKVSEYEQKLRTLAQDLERLQSPQDPQSNK